MIVTNDPLSGYVHAPGPGVPSGQSSLNASQRLSCTTLLDTVPVVFVGGTSPDSPVQSSHELPSHIELILPIKTQLGVHEPQSEITLQHEPELSTNPIEPETSRGLVVLLIQAIKSF